MIPVDLLRKQIIHNDYLLIDAMIALIGKQQLLHNTFLIVSDSSKRLHYSRDIKIEIFSKSLSKLSTFWQRGLPLNSLKIIDSYYDFIFLNLSDYGFAILIESFIENPQILSENKAQKILDFIYKGEGYIPVSPHPYKISHDKIHG